MNEHSKLAKLLAWLASTGRSKAWFARTIGYSYQETWAKLEGTSNLTDRFVVACFSHVEDLPSDIFGAHGYLKQRRYAIKAMPLEEAEEPTQDLDLDPSET